MENIWEILGIEETQDWAVIKRAYAALAKKYNPEEHPEEFLRIRKAYEKALEGSRSAVSGTAQGHTEGNASALEDGAGKGAAGRGPGKSMAFGQGFQWGFLEEKPFQNSPALEKFRELYTGKRRKDRTAWSDYFTSDAFLDAYHEKGFTELMVKVVKENKEAYPLPKEFLTELSIAYGLQCYGGQLRPVQNAVFSGLEHVLEIAGEGPMISRFKGSEPAMADGFSDYRELLRLAAQDVWDSAALLYLGKIIDRYQLSNLSDRPIRNADQYELSERHPKSVRLLVYFFSHYKLPKQAYRMLWNHLWLENATMGKEKLLYGGLREVVLFCLPELAQKPRVSFKQIIRDQGMLCTIDEKRWKAFQEFFSREDVRCALQDEAFVEEQVLHYWLTENSAPSYVGELKAFYEGHRDAPYADKVLEKIKILERQRKVRLELEEDEATEPAPRCFDFQSRPFVRHYLYTAFRQACGIQDDILLSDYLQQRMPYSEKWGRKLMDANGGMLSARMGFGENELSIIFHRRYIEYLWNGMPGGPLFSWEELKAMEDGAEFWMLLPISAAEFTKNPEVQEELASRLLRLPIDPEDIPAIADCIAGKVCRFEGEAEPICSFYKETEESLYGCDIYGNGMLFLFQEGNGRKQGLPNGDYRALDMDMAVRMGKRLLDELLDSYPDTAEITAMPLRAKAGDEWGRVKAMEGEGLAPEELKELFRQYLDGTLGRLELSWEAGDLVFVNQNGQYACFYFNNSSLGWYALVSLPELYEKLREDEVIYLPFGLGVLPEYFIHHNTNLMKKRLGEILSQMPGVPESLPGMAWGFHTCGTKIRFHYAKRIFGGYSSGDAYNSVQDSFYLTELPALISYTELAGGKREDKDTCQDEAAVQDALARYMAGELSRLVLTWKEGSREEGKDAEAQEEGQDAGSLEGGRDSQEEAENALSSERHILLLQDQGRYQLLYLEEGRKYLSYLVSDVGEYMRAEGKRYRRDTFFGKTVPAYLVHQDLRRIRDYLDLLLPMIWMPHAILDIFGEFSYQGSDYDKVKAEYGKGNDTEES